MEAPSLHRPLSSPLTFTTSRNSERQNHTHPPCQASSSASNKSRWGSIPHPPSFSARPPAPDVESERESAGRVRAREGEVERPTGLVPEDWRRRRGRWRVWRSCAGAAASPWFASSTTEAREQAASERASESLFLDGRSFEPLFIPHLIRTKILKLGIKFLKQ